MNCNRIVRIIRFFIISLVFGLIVSGGIIANADVTTYLENFDDGVADGWTTYGGTWGGSSGSYSQTNTTASAKAAYSVGSYWADYEFTADVRTPSNVNGSSTTGIIFRANSDMTNFYVFRFFRDTHLELGMSSSGSFTSLKKWSYASTVNTMYTLKVKAVGSDFTFYVNGVEVMSFSDTTHATGTVGLYAYLDTGVFDNVQVSWQSTYYVSPTGSDSNPGTYEQPWKSFKKATQTLQAGDTAVFEDGIYYETSIASFSNSGTALEPIIIKSRNKHQAVIIYPSSALFSIKIWIYGKNYINIQGLEITQTGTATESDPGRSGDILIYAPQANYCKFIGNKIHHAYEKGIMLLQSTGCVIQNNIISDITHDAINLQNVSSAVVSGNEIDEAGRCGITTAAGCRSININNNYIHNSDRYMLTTAIALGGFSSAAGVYDPSGYEAYNCVAWNNKIVANAAGKINWGIAYFGSIDCASYNNVIVGCNTALHFRNGGGINEGWTWNTTVTNPVVTNNIILDSVQYARYINNTPINLVSDYNLYYNSPNAPSEPNSVYSDPMFANKLNDWHLRSGSGAVDAGIPVSFTGFYGETIDVTRDYNGTQRVASWEMGIYSLSTYYVSPTGSDSNPGTYDQPWKSFEKVANTLQAGDTAIFENGTYNETVETWFKNSGTEEAPIIVKARNKHQALIVYPEAARLSQKIVLKDFKDYITIKDLAITQAGVGTESDPTRTNDLFIYCYQSNYCRFIGNKIYHGYEEGIKLSLTTGCDIQGNTISDFVHEGIDLVNVSLTKIHYNEIFDAGRVGIMTKGGSRSIAIYNNYIHNRDRYMSIAAITLGGSTGGIWVYDPSGYEAYNCVAFNNIIVAETPGQINYGIGFYGSIDCASYNNVVVGCNAALYFRNGGGIAEGWSWNTAVTNPVVKNNIILDSVQHARYFYNTPVDLASDYNLYYNSPNAPSESNSIYSAPMFVNKLSDWHLQMGSGAINSGTVVTFTGFYNEAVDVSRDYSDEQRTTPWDMGIYNVSP